MQFRKLEGPFCRDCGVAAFRHLTAETLVQGWWGPFSFFIANPFTLFMNLINRVRVGALAAPIPGSPALADYSAKAFPRRWEMVGLLVPLIPILLILSAASRSDSTAHSSSYPYVSAPAPIYSASDPRNAKPGDCVRDKFKGNLNAKYPELEIVPCSDARAQSVVLGQVSGLIPDFECGQKYPAADQVYSFTTSYGNGYTTTDFALCLAKRN
ncbi:hypothetical protein ACFVUS_25850 [Nocardia sp. NPDC058058]|uniref:LppU/SCO3897 family protein n=1 Tax=Nocardia sp. NPDC058058 TaxID=3346317 RepID=UPI0036DB467D